MVVNLSGRGDKDSTASPSILGASCDAALRLVERMARQGRIGWTLIIFGVGYHALVPQGAAVRDRARRSPARNGSIASACSC